MGVGMFDLLAESGVQVSATGFLDQLSFDELVEIDLENDRCRNIFHIEGKYYVPVADGSFHGLHDYCAEHMIHPDDKQVYLDFMDPNTLWDRLRASEVPGVLCEQFRYRLLDSNWRWTEQYVVGGTQHDLPEGIIHFYVIDIENRRSRELGSATRFQDGIASRNTTTSLLVDTAFFQRATELLEAGGGWYLVAMDIEHFKLFNDWYGRTAGDFLLANIGALLADLEENQGCLAGYLGLDDFALLVPEGEDVVGKLYDGICDYITEHGESIGFLPAFGICRQEEGNSILDMYDRAALACNLAKEHINERIRMFEPELYEQTDEEYRILTEFHKALGNGEICYYLQPQCRASTGKIVGLECLARWIRPNGEMVPPIKFIPILEKHGFVTDLDCFLWDQLCQRLKAWIDSGHSPVPVSINVSQVDIDLIDVVEHLKQLVAAYDIPPSLIKVEITESTYTNNSDEVQYTAEQLRECGFMVMMDDFGSGYSSLNMLRNLSVDVLKLDAFFLHMDAEDMRKGIRIVESVVNMAKTMALPIVAEGVETQEQVDFLSSLGCRYMQGFHFYRPMPPEQAEELLEDGLLVDQEGFISVPNDEFRIREFLDRNIYSDSMLNSILGSVALYLWHDSDVDIVRFNEQFYEAVDDAEFRSRLTGIQNFIAPSDVTRFYQLLQDAADNTLTGSNDIITFHTSDGRALRFLLHVFFLESQERGLLFYSSARNVTKLMELQGQMSLISRYSSDSIVFLHKRGDDCRFEVVVHGLEDSLGLSREEFEDELNDGSFYARIEEATDPNLSRQMRKTEEEDGFSYSFMIENARGEMIGLSVRADHVEGNDSGVSSILTFR